MEQKIVIIKIIDSDPSYDDRLLETFVVVNPTQEALDGLKDLIDSRYDDEGKWNDDWDWGLIYEYVNKHFTQLDFEEVEVEY